MTALTNDAILLAGAGAPLVILFLLRVNGAIAFFSLCAGSVLLTYAGSDTGLLASTFSGNATAEPLMRAAITLLPLILCLILLRKSVSAAKGLLNIVPLAATGLLGILLVVPTLPGGTQANLMATQTWRQINNFQELIVLGGVLACILFMMITHPKEHKSRKHH